ncbi:OX-2 membrane glycoprotein isoform X1 [Mus musculus]|uniref:OX-2 membrane glycoprotein isoform X1 n=1 Tax=Mus musculus TaxID=10090 RepID=UPI0007ED2BFF|nr:OX-2 membrane glycoprotein isoform X1 [Mus musculus]|eukprot:XP_017172379.1 PREDICTED: OX-2 membrane glycoprotein isoform X2 [Mus musculus]
MSQSWDSGTQASPSGTQHWKMRAATCVSSTRLVLRRSQEQLALPSMPIVHLHYNYFEDHLNITCSATARPAPAISWKGTGTGIENSTESHFHSNGTTSVTSILRVKDPKTQVGKEVICQVLYLGNVIDYKQSLDKGFWFSVPLLLSIVSLVILLILISILLYWKRHRNQERGESSQGMQRMK